MPPRRLRVEDAHVRPFVAPDQDLAAGRQRHRHRAFRTQDDQERRRLSRARCLTGRMRLAGQGGRGHGTAPSIDRGADPRKHVW